MKCDIFQSSRHRIEQRHIDAVSDFRRAGQQKWQRRDRRQKHWSVGDCLLRDGSLALLFRGDAKSFSLALQHHSANLEGR